MTYDSNAKCGEWLARQREKYPLIRYDDLVVENVWMACNLSAATALQQAGEINAAMILMGMTDCGPVAANECEFTAS